MNYNQEIIPATVLHWNYRGFTEFPLQRIQGEESDITDIYLKENLITRVPTDIGRLHNLESLYLSGNDITELPKEICKLQCLKCLDVSGNRLRYIPDEIGEVRNLKFLILDENELCELPLRIAEIRGLRYLSVCDNKLRWLPQHPVYNYHHCEFRFWRNSNLMTIPYSLWYHMFRNQQTRSLNIGCLTIPNYQIITHNSKCRLKLSQDSREWHYDISCPPQYNNVLETNMCSPPSLLEVCRRKFYQMISEAAKKLTDSKTPRSIYCDNYYNDYRNEDDNIMNIQNNFEEININNNQDFDINGNNYLLKLIPTVGRKDAKFNKKKGRVKDYYTPADVIDEYFCYLPKYIKSELSNGPVSRCENVDCKKPIFDYVLYEFCFGKIILIDNIENVILSSAFCSKFCANSWKNGRENLISWTLMS